MTIVIQLLTLLAQIVGELQSASSIANVITTLEQIIAAGIEEIQTVAPMIKNIIAALKANTAVTADQMAQLAALDTQTDLAFEAAAQAAGADPAAPSS